jgi:hypothetical protein
MAANEPIHLKVMTWNLKNFSSSKFSNDDGSRRLDFVVDILTRHHDLKPDICVITEVMTAMPPSEDYSLKPSEDPPSVISGRLVGGGGSIGIRQLYGVLDDSEWSLVPPRNLSVSTTFTRTDDAITNECVGILFRNERLQFWGPDYNANVNNQALAQPFQQGVAATPASYPGTWDLRLPESGVTPPNAQQAVPQNQLSGRLLSPKLFRQNDRAPFYTLFAVLNKNGAPAFLLHLVSAHLPVSKPLGSGYNPALEDKHPVMSLLQATDQLCESFTKPPFNKLPNYCVIAGDFNNRVDPLFGPKGYSVALNEVSAADGRKTSTIYKGYNDIKYNQQFLNQPYPGYDYLQIVEADNIMVFPPPKELHKPYIANPVVGARYVKTGEPISNDPAAYDYPPKLSWKLKGSSGVLLGGNVVSSQAVPTGSKLGMIRGIVNEARWVSDHLPLMVKITIDVN